jgi:hypothetical protein
MESTNTSPGSRSDKAKPKRKRGDRLMWDEVLLTLERHRDAVSTNGAILSRPVASTGKVAYSVRVRVRAATGTKHLRLPLGMDPQVAAQARQLIARWQGERDPRRSPDPAVREMWTMAERYARSLPRALQQRCIRHFRPLLADRMALLAGYHDWNEIEATYRRQRLRSPRGRAHLTWLRPDSERSDPDYAPQTVAQKAAAAVFQLAFGT